MRKLNKKFTLDNSGVVLMSVMIILLVMSIIISGVVFITINNLNNSQKTADYTETYYTAEGGINFLTSALETRYTDAPKTSALGFFNDITNFVAGYKKSDNKSVAFSDNGGKASQALIWISDSGKVGNTQTYTLHSEGYIGSVKRTLTKDIQIVYEGGNVGFRDAIFSRGNITLGKSIIKGSIATNAVTASAINFKNGGGSVTEVWVPTNLPTGVLPSQIINSTNPIVGGSAGIHQETAPILKDVVILGDPSPLTKIPYKQFFNTAGAIKYTLIDNSGNLLVTNGTTSTGTDLTYINAPLDLSIFPNNTNFTIPKFIISSDTTYSAPNFAINVGNNNYTVFTNTLWLKNTLKVTGSGTLTIIVNDSTTSTNYDSTDPFSANPTPIIISSNGLIGNENYTSSKLLIYVQKILNNSNPINLTLGSGHYYFSLFADNLNYTLDSINVHGVVSTNLGTNIYLSPSSNSIAMLVYAPQATVSLHAASIVFKGAIVCKVMTLDQPNAAISPTLIFDGAVNQFVSSDIIGIDGISVPSTTKFIKSATLE